jgi:hypothetical protein
MQKHRNITVPHGHNEKTDITDDGFGMLFEAIWKQAVNEDINHARTRLIKDVKWAFGIETLSVKAEVIIDAAMVKINKAVRQKVYKEALLWPDAPHPQRQDKEYESAYGKAKNEVIRLIGDLNYGEY